MAPIALSKALCLIAGVAVAVAALWYGEFSLEVNASLIPAWDSSFFLFVASTMCETGLVLCRRQYKLSERYRSMVKSSSFSETPDDAPAAEKACVMQKLFVQFPHTVSEMVHAQANDHAMIFKAFMMTAAVLLVRVDFDDLTPHAGPLPTWLLGFNHLRFTMLVCGVFGFPLVPSPPAAFDLREDADKRARFLEALKNDAVPEEGKESFMRHATLNRIHAKFALPLLIYLPLLEFLVLPRNLYTFYVAAAAGNVGAVGSVWLLITMLRLFVLVTCFTCTAAFMRHFTGGMFLDPEREGYKVFWMEYSMCLCFDHLMQLLALSDLFDFSAPERFLEAPRWLRVLALALTASRAAYVLPETAHNLRVALKDVDYSEADYVWFFARWKREEKQLQEEMRKASATATTSPLHYLPQRRASLARAASHPLPPGSNMCVPFGRRRWNRTRRKFSSSRRQRRRARWHSTCVMWGGERVWRR